jgi:hypothetical protein
MLVTAQSSGFDPSKSAAWAASGASAKINENAMNVFKSMTTPLLVHHGSEPIHLTV